VQTLLSQQVEALQAHMDGFVPKAAQEGRACGNYQEETED